MLHRLSFLALIAVLAPASARADLTTGLIASYPFNGNAQDASGNGNHGSPNATMQLTTDRFGTPNAAYLFNGLNSYITVNSSASLQSATPHVSQFAWVELHGPSQVGAGFCPVIMKSNTTENAFMYRMHVEATAFGSAYNNWDTDRYTSRPFVNNQWYFIGTTYDGSKIRFFVDGALVDSAALALTITPDTRPLAIGADTPGVLEIFNGKIDEVRLYNRALAPAEVQELYASSTTAVSMTPRLGGDPALRAHPNPARAATTIEFEIARATVAELSVHDVLGRRLRVLQSGSIPTGHHAVVWDGRDAQGRKAAAGLYFVRLDADGQRFSRRILRIE